MARATMVLVGLLILLFFSALGGTLSVMAWTDGSPIGWVLVGLTVLLVVAAYGAWLAWRGLGGYSRPAPRAQQAMVAIMGVLLAFAAAAFVGNLVRVISVGPVRIQHATWHSFDGEAWYAVMLALALPIQLTAHEVGHVLAGRWAGFDFLAIQVGPLFLDRQGRRWRASWQPLTFGLGGRAIMTIRGGGHLGRRRALFAAGGPAANLLLALAAGLAAAVLPWPVTAPGAVGLGLLEGCAIEGCLLGLFNLLPVSGSGTDGARIREALRGPV